MSICVDSVLIAGSPETLEEVKEMINLKFKIQESGKVKKFLRVYYGWGHDTKRSYAKTTMETDVNKLVDGYDNFNGIDIKVHKTPGVTGTNLSKSEIKEAK